MGNQFYVIGAIIIVILLFLIPALYNKRKLRKMIKNKWGTWPHEVHFDSEKSLRESYEQLKMYINKDSYIDDITWKDLNMFQVFEQINHTYSSIGSEALYRRLRSFDFDDKDQINMENLITFYKRNPRLREEIEYIFVQLGKKDSNFVVQYLMNNNQKNLLHLGLYIFLGLLPVISLVIFLSGLFQFGFTLFLGSIIFNLIYSQVKKIRLRSELDSLSYLVQTISTAKKLSKIKHPMKKELKSLLSSLQHILKFSFPFRVKGNSGGEIILDYLNMLFLIPFISYHFVFNRIKKHESEVISMWQVLGDLEAACAILNYRTVSSLHCQPDFNSNDEVIATKLYHPLVESPVVNPVNWERNTLVSGSNASGKSTYVKSIAINCILAQTIYTCLAESFSFQPGHVLTSMAVEDDVIKGDSYFIAEIKSLKRVLSKVETKERCYCFIDEILKGTNTVERIAASSSMITWLNYYPSLTFVATHDIELTEILKSQCDNVHFQESVTNKNGVEFDYKIRSGPATSRNALQLLQIMNFPETVVIKAKEKAVHFDQTKNWIQER